MFMRNCSCSYHIIQQVLSILTWNSEKFGAAPPWQQLPVTPGSRWTRVGERGDKGTSISLSGILGVSGTAGLQPQLSLHLDLLHHLPASVAELSLVEDVLSLLAHFVSVA